MTQVYKKHRRNIDGQGETKPAQAITENNAVQVKNYIKIRK